MHGMSSTDGSRDTDIFLYRNSKILDGKKLPFFQMTATMSIMINYGSWVRLHIMSLIVHSLTLEV